MNSIDWDKNYYAVLGISSKASIDEINKRYKFLVRLNHPDINKNADEEFLRELNEAHDVLSNKTSKALYDRHCILDLEYEDIKNGYITEDILEKNSLANSQSKDEKRRFFSEELNNPYVSGNSYSPEYQRAIDGRNIIIDYFDKEIIYLNAYKRELKVNKSNVISYDNETVKSRLSLPFFNEGMKLLNVYNLDLSNDKEFLLKKKKIKNSLYETIYVFARILENKSYSFLCGSNCISKNEFYIEKANELYEVIFNILDMTTSEALFYDMIYKSIKKHPKDERKYIKYKYEISLCYATFKKLCIIKEKEKKLVKTK